MKIRAHNKHVMISPQKLRLVCDEVRGMDARQADVLLKFLPQKGAQIIRKTLASAMANAEENFEANPSDLYIEQIYANEGPRLRRFKAGARGRYKPRVRRTAHLTVVLAQREVE
ncbi:MAG: 50S ribosomal protein L22 [Anaerolineaceae bacterium]|nr:MAG: 50S ribosomal protein L22 [Anaerolineaceae bacterium]